MRKQIMAGVSLSHWQKPEKTYYTFLADEAKFAIIKAGQWLKKDVAFETHYQKCKEAGMHVGAYYYAPRGRVGMAAGITDANTFLKMINGKTFTMPVYLDYEEGNTTPEYKKLQTDYAIAFCETMEQNGAFVGIYGGDICTFRDRLNLSNIAGRFTLWVARYGKFPVVVKQANVDIWQFKGEGRLEGQTQNMTLEKCYVDFPAIIDKKGFNRF